MLQKTAPSYVLIWVTGVKFGTGRPSSDNFQIGTILLTLIPYIVRMLTMKFKKNMCIYIYIVELELFISLSSSHHLNAGDHAWNTYFKFVLNMLFFLKELISYLM